MNNLARYYIKINHLLDNFLLLYKLHKKSQDGKLIPPTLLFWWVTRLSQRPAAHNMNNSGIQKNKLRFFNHISTYYHLWWRPNSNMVVPRITGQPDCPSWGKMAIHSCSRRTGIYSSLKSLFCVTTPWHCILLLIFSVLFLVLITQYFSVITCMQ